MAVTFTILKDLGVVYVKYSGRVTVHESMELFARYMSHPDSRPGQKQFVDLADLTEPDFNYTELMKFQAQKADFFQGDFPQTLVAYFAPTEKARHLAMFAMRSWSKVDHMICRMIDDEAAALAFLGLPVKSISDLLTEV